jgi:hypothetical protein
MSDKQRRVPQFLWADNMDQPAMPMYVNDFTDLDL